MQKEKTAKTESWLTNNPIAAIMKTQFQTQDTMQTQTGRKA